MPPPPLRRLFLALDLPPDVTAALTAWRPPIPGARWLPEDHLHLTTRFLGPTDPERLAAITEVVRGLRSDPVPVTTGALLRLPSARRPRALAAAVDDSRALRAVVGRLDRRRFGALDLVGDFGLLGLGLGRALIARGEREQQRQRPRSAHHASGDHAS